MTVTIPVVQTVPLAADEHASEPIVRASTRRLHIPRPSGWTVLFGAALVWYVWWFSWTSLQVHNGLGTSAYDFGLYDQGIWLLSRFKAPFVTLMGRNLFGDHASFILLPLVPLYWLFPGAGTLFFVQSVAMAGSAIPVFLLAKRLLKSEAAACLLGCAYLMHPAVGLTNRESFHPDAFLGLTIGFAIYAALGRKWRLYAVAVVLSLMVKEDVSLVVLPLGVWVYLRRDRRVAVLTIVGCVFAAFVATYVVMRSLIGVPTRNGWRVPFGGPKGFISKAMHRPGEVWDYLRSDHRPFYLWQLTGPFAFIFLRMPDVAMISSVVVSTNIVSTFAYQYRIGYHYSLIALPALALGTVHALSTMGQKTRRAGIAAVFIASLWAGHLWGVLPFSRAHGGYWSPKFEVPVAFRQIAKGLPPDAIISTQHALAAHLNHRQYIYMFPNPFRVTLYGPDLKLEEAHARLPIADRVEYVILPVGKSPEMQGDWDAVKAAFTLERSNQWWEVWHKVGTLPPPTIPTTLPPAVPTTLPPPVLSPLPISTPDVAAPTTPPVTTPPATIGEVNTSPPPTGTIAPATERVSLWGTLIPLIAR